MRKFHLKVSLLLLFMAATICAAAQSQVSGVVRDADNQSTLPGVSVVVKGSSRGTTTDIDGRFNIPVAKTDVLEFTFIGYQKTEVNVGDRTELSVLLNSETSKLDEVIVVGYGTVRKSDLTGSVSQVGSKDITRVAAANISQAIQGNVSGLWANQSDNSPGATANIQLRGSNSFSGNSPLYIVDGFPLTSDASINAISPNDIESISVLKDASSTAIYGARAANGVIVITTKSGKTGKNNLEVSAFMAIKSFVNNIEMMNGEEYAALRRDAFKNDNVNGGVAEFYPQELASLEEGRSTDWWREITGTARMTQNYQLNFTNGTEKTKIMIGANFYNEQGVVNNTDFLRGGIRSNISHKIGDLTVVSNTNITVTNGQATTGESVLYPSAVGNPLSPLRDADGNYYTMQVGLNATPLPNPVVYNEQIKNRFTQPVINSSLSLDYAILNGLNIKTQLSGEFDHYKLNYYVPRAISDNHSESGRNTDGFAKATANNNYNWMSETTIHYKNTFGGLHGIELLGGFSAQQNRWEGLTASASGFLFDIFGAYNMGQSYGTPKKPSTDLQEWSMLSYFGRAIYTLNNKYILTANFRADGSSRFGKNNKWGYFPSAAAAWKLSDEQFIKDLNIFDELKLRGSLGLAGNAYAINVYATQARMGKTSYTWGDSEAIGYYVNTIPSPNLKWETTRQVDLGLDVSILQRRLNISLDYYHKNTYDLIREVPILAVSGFQKSLVNMGELVNQGVELTLNTVNIKGEFQWSTMLTAAHNTNKLKSLGDGAMQIGTDHWVGKPIDIGKRYMLESNGIWQLGEESKALKYGARPGDVRYVDQPTVDENGVAVAPDGKIDDKDKVFIGRLTPVLYGALNNDFSYKGFNLNVFLTYETGRDIYNGNNYLYLSGDGIYNNRREMLDRWTETNPSNKYPRASKSMSNRRSEKTSEFLEKADFIKIKSVTFGYTLPSIWAAKMKAQQVYFYLSGINLLTFTGYSGYDPENGDTGNTERFATYPMTRSFILGLNLKF